MGCDYGLYSWAEDAQVGEKLGRGRNWAGMLTGLMGFRFNNSQKTDLLLLGLSQKKEEKK